MAHPSSTFPGAKIRNPIREIPDVPTQSTAIPAKNLAMMARQVSGE